MCVYMGAPYNKMSRSDGRRVIKEERLARALATDGRRPNQRDTSPPGARNNGRDSLRRLSGTFILPSCPRPILPDHGGVGLSTTPEASRLVQAVRAEA